MPNELIFCLHREPWMTAFLRTVASDGQALWLNRRVIGAAVRSFNGQKVGNTQAEGNCAWQRCPHQDLNLGCRGHDATS